MDNITRWDLWVKCNEIAKIVEREGEPLVVIFRTDGTFQTTMVNPSKDELPADAESPHTHI